MQKTNALIIGSSGALAQAFARVLIASHQYHQIHVVGRTSPEQQVTGVVYHQLDNLDEQQVQDWCKGHKNFSLVICATGVLHDDVCVPEKKLEQISIPQLQHYFKVNTLLPSLWIKHAVALFAHDGPAHLVCLSARVGSITDNHLGGWYGYRASKAALNMLLRSAQVEYHRRMPNVCLVAYHPGTVDSPLSQPYQANVKRLLDADFSAQSLLKQLPELEPGCGCYFRDWLGQDIDW